MEAIPVEVAGSVPVVPSSDAEAGSALAVPRLAADYMDLAVAVWAAAMMVVMTADSRAEQASVQRRTQWQRAQREPYDNCECDARHRER